MLPDNLLQIMNQYTGIKFLDIFGLALPEPPQILKMTKTNASLIIDNAHNPLGLALKETLPQTDYFVLLNFPGSNDTRTLEDVIE